MTTAKELREALADLDDETTGAGWLDIDTDWEVNAVGLNKHAYVTADAARTIALPILEADPELVERIGQVVNDCELTPVGLFDGPNWREEFARYVLAAISTPTPGAE